ncbi:MAG: methionyl-tRNA formyltransferase [Patescibacteria group bacterium]|nr:methionyl-tRNA formyltransferase [Patescibacteria group bacterium]
MSNENIKFAFFGSSRFSVIVLDELEMAGFVPECVVTVPDKPTGRKMKITPTEVKKWAQKRNIKIYAPERLSIAKDGSRPNGKAAQNAAGEFSEELAKENCEVFIVASYGKIIPSNIIKIPPRRTLNVHPSLLPKYRGASPLQSVIIADDKNTGVTVIEIDEQMDHGPIVAQEKISINEWLPYEEFEEKMARAGGVLLSRILPDWIAGNIAAVEQDHFAATYTKKIAKEDGLIDLNGDPYLNFRKIQAYHEWPQTYFFAEKGDRKIRVKVARASFKDGKLFIEAVVPEGRKEMPYCSFRQSFGSGY